MHNQRYLAEAEARWIEEKIGPNIYAVATLRQSLCLETNGYKTWVKGSPTVYDTAAAATLNNLSRRIYKSANRRFGKQLPVATTLEGDGYLKRYHLNLLIRKPEWMGFDQLASLFAEEWLKNSWALPEYSFEQRTGDCVRYSLKEGPEALLLSSTRF